MGFSDITSREAIIKAVEECDLLGEEDFLKMHGFGRAIKYFLVFEEKHL
jgi:hypothetical protein